MVNGQYERWQSGIVCEAIRDHAYPCSMKSGQIEMSQGMDRENSTWAFTGGLLVGVVQIIRCLESG